MKKTELNLTKILEDYKNGSLSASEASEKISAIYAASQIEVPGAVLDLARERRAGFPEAVYAAGKTSEQVCAIFKKLFEANGKALATRCSDETLQRIEKEFPDAEICRSARLAWIRSDIELNPAGKISIIAAGTSDMPVAEEAALTLEFSGFLPQRIFDVGVAGIHRLFERLSFFSDSDVVIVVAGMEGALPSVVGGLVSCPVIAVPTSIGYGASFNGLAALLGMLNSCSAGITVVNIDNGFGAAAAAVRVLKGMNK